MLDDDDNLGIYDDLDEFQQAEDHKSKELLAWEEKHKDALAEIEGLKARNKALEKKMKTMEVNLQNLLDTAKSEMKRKEVLIGQLRKEKDDICFRRKRGREAEDPADKGHENKRLKTVSKADAEVKKNPFKADSKSDAKPVGKRRSRSKSPSSSHQKATERRSKIQEHGRNKSRERRRSRSRSPRHSSRQEEHRSHGSSSRPTIRRSRSHSPRAQVTGSKSQKMTSPNGRESERKPYHEKAKKKERPPTPIEVSTPEMAAKKTQDSEQVPSIECEDTSAVDGHYQEKTPCEPLNNPSMDKNGNIGASHPVFGEAKEEFIPGLDMICEEPAQSCESSAAKTHSEDSEVDQSKEIMSPDTLTSVPKEEPKPNPISADHAPADEHPQVDAIAIECSIPAKESLIRNTNYEPTDGDCRDNDADKSDISHPLNTLTKNPEAVVAAGTAESDENVPCSAGESISKPNTDCCDVGVRIIEDIRLPEVANIGHIAVIVDRLCGGTKSVADDQENPSGKDDPCDYNKAKQPTTPSSSSSVLYAQPDSTKVDHNDGEHEVTLEAALNLLPASDLVAPPTQSASDQSYPNLSLEEDAIEKALGQLHQTSSPDETAVTSTSSRAQQDDIPAPATSTSTSLNRSPLQTKSHSPEKLVIEKSPQSMKDTDDSSRSLVSKSFELELPSPGQDITIDETIGDVSVSNEEDLSTVTKRCSLGHTDYQFEQRNDEIILRVKRRTRRRCLTPLEAPVPNPSPKGGRLEK